MNILYQFGFGFFLAIVHMYSFWNFSLEHAINNDGHQELVLLGFFTVVYFIFINGVCTLICDVITNAIIEARKKNDG